MEKSHTHGVEYPDSTHQRKLQRDCRSAFEKHSHLDRVVLQPGRLPSYPSSECSSPSGSLCNESQQQVENIHLPLSGSASSWRGCDDNTLGTVGTPVPVPSDESSFKGFSEAISHQLPISDPSNTQIPDKTVIHGAKTTPNTIDHCDSYSPTDGGGQANQGQTADSACRLDVIKRIYERRMPSCKDAIALTAEPIKKSSTASYQQKWKVFLEYIQSQKRSLDEVTLETVINFLTHLFHNKTLKPSTIAHYRSALAVPLQLHCGINLRITEVNQLLRGMSLLRPKATVTAPGWKLSTVLDFLEQ